MKRRLVVAGLTTVWFVATGFGTPPPPRPTHVYVNSNSVDINTTDCAFPVKIQTTGYGIVHTMFYPNGSRKQTIITQPTTRVTFTNLDTGKSVSTPSVNLTIIRYDTAGNMVAKTSPGLMWRIVVPGKGLVAADIGQVGWKITFDSNGNIVSFDPISSGIRDGVTVAKLCDVLD